MTPTNDDRIQRTLIDLIAGNIQMFLLDQRRARRNDSWFTVAQIADELDMRPHLVLYYLALKQLVANPLIERFEGQIRWCSI